MNDLLRPIVFVGASVLPLEASLLASADLRPPVRRGDIAQLAGERPGLAVIIDGFFGATLAVSPTECRDALDAGWTLVGCSSMGALRAADLWPLGMIGMGWVYHQYRLGRLVSDADVAVALHPDSHAELTVSTVHLRFMLDDRVRRGILETPLRARMEEVARSIHWEDRSWRACQRAWAAAQIPEAAIQDIRACSSDPTLHPKVVDAKTTLEMTLGGDGRSFLERVLPVEPFR